MKKPTHHFFLALLSLLFITLPSAVSAQLPPVEVIDGMADVFEEKDRHIRSDRQRREQERREEEAIRRQQEEMRRNPGSYPRERYSHEAALNENPWAREARRRSGAPVHVEIFVAERCFDCDRMERYLDEVGVPYIRHFLEPGNEAEEQYLAQIGRGPIPVVRINGRVVRGFQPEEVRKVILEEKPR